MIFRSIIRSCFITLFSNVYREHMLLVQSIVV